MTDRLGELQVAQPTSSVISDDIETGRDTDADAELAKFTREADAIDKVFVWANKSIATINASMADPDTFSTVDDQLTAVDKKLDAVRKRLKRIAGENKQLASSPNATPSKMRIRVSRYTKLGNDFMNIVSRMQSVREAHKNLATDAVKQDVLRANPNASEAEVDRALDNSDPAQLDALVSSNNPQLRHQLEDLHARNRDIQNLTKNIVELHQMFTDMSILVEGQQELINDIEYNVKEVKVETKKAADELVEALAHQRSARKKKMCICIIVTVIVVVILLAIIIPIGRSLGWFDGSGSNSSGAANTAPENTAPENAAAASPTPQPQPSQTTTALRPVEVPSFIERSVHQSHLQLPDLPQLQMRLMDSRQEIQGAVGAKAGV